MNHNLAKIFVFTYILIGGTLVYAADVREGSGDLGQQSSRKKSIFYHTAAGPVRRYQGPAMLYKNEPVVFEIEVLGKGWVPFSDKEYGDSLPVGQRALLLRWKSSCLAGLQGSGRIPNNNLAPRDRDRNENSSLESKIRKIYSDCQNQ